MTTLKLTYQDVLALKPCSIDRVPYFGRRKYLTAAQALERGATIEDLLWVAGQIGRKDLCVRFALACTQRVTYLNPDPRVQAALHVTQAWLDAAGDAAGDAGDAADAARAAARAAAWDAWDPCAAGAAGAARAATWAAWAAGDACPAGAAGAASWAAQAAGDAAGAAARDAAGDARQGRRQGRLRDRPPGPPPGRLRRGRRQGRQGRRICRTAQDIPYHFSTARYRHPARSSCCSPRAV